MLTYYIKTFGCQMNYSDSERMQTFFKLNGFAQAAKAEEADLVIFNTCGVRQTAEDRVFGLAHKLHIKKQAKKINPFVIITGCLAHRDDVQQKMKEKVDLFMPIADVIHIFEHLPQHLQTQQKTCPEHYLYLSPTYKYTDIAYVPIMTGCNNFCSYCVVPYARGREWSRPVQDIMAEVDKLSQNGCKEITLLGQNVNSYSYQTKSTDNAKQNITGHITFPVLLSQLATTYPAITFKFLTSHPKDYSDDLIDVIAKHNNISKDIHLPIQSGSDRILKAMNRPYTQAHYLGLIEKTRTRIPQARFSTDVILGFPGETEEDFQETVEVFKTVGFYEAFLNKYSPRPGTAAYKLENNIPWSEKKRREKVLRDLFPISQT